MLGRLQTLGFDKITVMMDGILKFVARKPAAGSSDCGAEPGVEAFGESGAQAAA